MYLYRWGSWNRQRGENSHYLDQRPEDSYWKMIKKWFLFTKYFALFQASYICSLVLPTTCEIGALSFRVYRWGNGGKATIWQGWNLNAVSVVLRAGPLTARPCSHSRLSSPICVPPSMSHVSCSEQGTDCSPALVSPTLPYPLDDMVSLLGCS